MRFGQYIRDRRNEMGVSLRYLCEYLGYNSPGTMSEIERGIRKPIKDIQALKIICNILDIDFNYLKSLIQNEDICSDCKIIREIVTSDPELFDLYTEFHNKNIPTEVVKEEFKKFLEISLSKSM